MAVGVSHPETPSKGTGPRVQRHSWTSNLSPCRVPGLALLGPLPCCDPVPVPCSAPSCLLHHQLLQLLGGHAANCPPISSRCPSRWPPCHWPAPDLRGLRHCSTVSSSGSWASFPSVSGLWTHGSTWLEESAPPAQACWIRLLGRPATCFHPPSRRRRGRPGRETASGVSFLQLPGQPRLP